MQTIVDAQPSAPALSLDQLATESFAELDARYRKGTLPASLLSLNGAHRGRMLAVKALDRGPAARLLARLARSPEFVWEGKTFESKSDGDGRGLNRVRLAGVLGRQSLFPFELRFGESEIDSRPAIVLDYDLSDNPGYIRRIRDEVRLAAPGILLGPAMWRTRGGFRNLMWFALDTGKR